jgi:hypothetical protein
MFGQQALDKLRLQKQSLILESSVNRLTLQTEVRELRSAAAWMSPASHVPRPVLLLLGVLAPLAGFFLTRGVRRPVSLLSRVFSLLKLIGPLYSLWRGIAAARKSRSGSVPAAL